MPLINSGWLDRVAVQISYVISLLGTVSTPETATDVVAGGTAYAGWRFNADGTTDIRQNTWTTGYDDWATPQTPPPAATFDIRATKQSGTKAALDTGNLNTWESLSGTITYDINNAAQDDSTEDIVIKVEIRKADSQEVQDTGYYKMAATSQSTGLPGPGEATP